MRPGTRFRAKRTSSRHSGGTRSLALWLIASPFALGYSSPALIWSDGIWLMCAPGVFGIGIQEPAADSDHLVGALTVVVAVIALAEVARPARFLNIPLGLWLLVAPWFLDGATALSRWNSAWMGAAIVVLSLPLGKLRDHYGSFDPLLLWSPRASARERHRQRQWGPASETRARRLGVGTSRPRRASRGLLRPRDAARSRAHE